MNLRRLILNHLKCSLSENTVSITWYNHTRKLALFLDRGQKVKSDFQMFLPYWAVLILSFRLISIRYVFVSRRDPHWRFITLSSRRRSRAAGLQRMTSMFMNIIALSAQVSFCQYLKWGIYSIKFKIDNWRHSENVELVAHFTLYYVTSRSH